jgi:chemotaxis protein MotB
MRTYLAMGLVASLLLGVLSAGGCVSKEEYDKVLAANRRANDELLKAQQALRDAMAENQRLTAELADRDRVLQAKNDEIALLEKAKADLQRAFDELKAMYDKKGMTAAPPPLEIVLPPSLDKALRDLAAQYPDLIEYYPKYGMVKFKADLTFEKGSDEVSATAKEALAKFVQIINSEAAAKFNIYVAGHTDDIPIRRSETMRRHPNNWYLSVHRSVAVEEELAKDGLAPARIGVMGFSEYHPVEANAPGNKGNRANRRVEIWIVPPDRFLTGAVSSVASEAPAEPAEKPAQ